MDSRTLPQKGADGNGARENGGSLALDAPQPPRSPLARVQPGSVDVERIKRRGWVRDGILVVSENDQRLTGGEQTLVRQLGNKLYGRGPVPGEVHRGG